MYIINSRRYTWDGIISTVLELPKHKDLRVEQWQVPEIPDYFEKRSGDNDGQIANLGVKLNDGKAIHLKIYEDYYKIHWDEKDPNTNPLGHLLFDAPHWLLIIGIILLAILAL